MSSPVDGLRDSSGGGLEQEALETIRQNDDSFHKSYEVSAEGDAGIPSSEVEKEEELLKTPPYIKTVNNKSEDNRIEMLNSVEQPSLKEDDVEGNSKGVQSSEMMSLGPDLTITEVDSHCSAVEKKTPLEVSIFKVDNPAVNGNVDAQDGSKTGHINGMVVINGKKSTNGSSDFTPSKPVVTPLDDNEDNAEDSTDNESNQLKTQEIPVIKWGIMKKRQSTPPIRQKKYPVLAPKPFAETSSPQSPSSPAAVPAPPTSHEVFLQFVGIPPQYIPKTDKLPTDNKIKLQPISPQAASGVNTVQRPTALVNPFPAQKLVRDNSAVSVLSKGTQADNIPESVFSANNIFGALVLNAPSLAVGEWKSKNSLDASDSEKRSISSATKVGSKQHQRWTQTTLLDFHKIKSLTTSPTNVQPLTTASAQQQQTLQQQQQQLQQQFRNKNIAQPALNATTMLTSVLARLQVGGTVKIENAGNNSIQQTKQDNANILQHFLAAQQLAAADHVTGNPIAVLSALNQQQQMSTTPAEVINMLKRLGTVVEVEEQNEQKPAIPSDIPSIASDTSTDQVPPSTTPLSLLESIKIDKPQSPVVSALEESPANNNVSSHQISKCIPPIPTTTFYLGKDVSVFPHVTPPVSAPSSSSSHVPCTPSPVQPKRSQFNTNSTNKSSPNHISSTPTQPRLPPDVSVFATTRVATNNGIESKTVQQWSLPALVQQVGLTPKSHQQQQPQHVILDEINNMNLQRSRLNQQQQPLAPLPPILLQVTSVNQPAQRSPKRKQCTTTKDIPQQNHVTSLHPFEPEINIFEGDNVLSPDGNTFVFNMDTFCNVDLLNKDMIYSCDICSAVYQHPYRLKKHYLRLHINRKYISKKDLDSFNIDPSLEGNDEAIEQDSTNTDSVDGKSFSDDCIKLVFRCHTCRKCVATKAELKSHLTDHPPVVNLKKQVVKGVKNYKCDYCKTYFKWKKMYLKHKKNCRLQPHSKDTSAPVTPVVQTTAVVVTSTPTVSSTTKTRTTAAAYVTTSSTTPSVNTTTPVSTKADIKQTEKQEATTTPKTVDSSNASNNKETPDINDLTTTSVATPTLSSSAATTPISSSAQSTPSSSAATLPFKRRRRLKRSLNNNTIRHYFHCLYCNETFLDSRKKRNHTLSNHPYLRKSHLCVFCQNDFTSNSLLFNHLLDVHQTIYFGCLPCKDRFTNLEELGNHNNKKHKNEDEKKIEFDKRVSTLKQDKDCYTCNKCKRMFVIENCFKTHVCNETPPENDNEKNSLNSSTSATPTTTTTTTTTATATSTPTTAPNTRKSTGGVSPNDIKTNNNNNGNNSTAKKDKPAKIRSKKSKISEREKKTDTRVQPVDPEVVFYSQISQNVRDNLMNHLDGRLAQSDDERSDDVGSGKGRTKKSPTKLSGVKRKMKSLKSNGKTSTSSADGTSGNSMQKGVGNSSDLNAANLNDNGIINKPRSSHWEKYAFPKEYDGRCGLTSYIKDISYLDISTQMMIRRNMELESMNNGNNMMEEYQCLSGDVGEVPSAIMLERMASKCAESFINDDSTIKGGDDPLHNDGISTAVGELCGEWVRERTYVCQVCSWETSCLWAMEDHKYDIHPSVVCPRLELVGDQRKLAKTIYTRLSEAPAPFASSSSPFKKCAITPQDIACTKCQAKGFQTSHELHVHILECAGEKVPEWLRSGIVPNRSQTPRKKKWARKRRRPRRGLKRNIPSTPQKPNKLRSKPGDTDSIQKMIANLPAKRLTRRVIAFDEKDLKSRSHSFNQNPQLPQGGKSSGTKGNVGKSKTSGHDHLLQAAGAGSTGSAFTSNSSSTMRTSTNDESSTSLTTNNQNNRIDTSAESGNVLSSLRMMPVSTPRQELLGTQQILDRVLGVSARVKEEEASLSSGVKCTGCGQSYESKAVLRRHHKSCAYFRECGPTSQHQCQTCHKTFDNLVALIEHSCDETPPRLEAEDINRLAISAPVTRSKADPDIPVLTPAALDTDNKVTLQASKVNGKDVNQSQSNLFGGYLIPLVVHNSPVNIIPITFTGTIPTVYNFTSNNIKSSLTLNEKTAVNTNDGTNKRSRPKRKSSEDAAMAVFHTINSGRRSMNNPLRVEKKSAPRRRRTRKAISNENTEKPETSQENAVDKKTPSVAVVKLPKKSISRRRGRPGPRKRTQPRKILPKENATETTTEMDEVKSVLEEVLQKIKDEKPDEITGKSGTVKKKRRRRRGNKREQQAAVAVKEPPVPKPPTPPPQPQPQPAGETPPVVKRKPGRPFGSKTKNRGKSYDPIRKGRKGAPPRRSLRGKNSLETTSTATPTTPSTPTKVTVKQESDDIVKQISHINVADDLNINSAQKRSLSLDRSITKQTDNLVELQDNKKRRSRWSGKQNSSEEITSDTTTIVVQAEIHPEPSPRKVKKDIGSTSDRVGSESKPLIKRSNSRGSLGTRRKRNGAEDFLQPRKKVKPEVNQETNVDEISVIGVEEIILDTSIYEVEKIMDNEQVENNEEISQEEQNNIELNNDSIVENHEEDNVKEIKKEIEEVEEEHKVEFKEDDLIPKPIKEEIKCETAVSDSVQVKSSINVENSKEDNVKLELENANSVKKTKRKNKKKKKDTESIQPSTIKKVKKLSKDEKLKKNIKATALGIAKLKKKKRLLQVKNDKNEHKKKEVVKIAGQSWEISDLNKSPEKSGQNSVVIENFVRTTPQITKYGSVDPQVLCTCPIRYQTGLEKIAVTAATPICSRHLYRYIVREGIDPHTGRPYVDYKWTEEEWFAQLSGPLPSSNVQPVHPAPSVIQQLSSGNHSQTLCTLQPASFNQHTEKSLSSLLEQMENNQSMTSQPTTLVNFQQDDTSLSQELPPSSSQQVDQKSTSVQQTGILECLNALKTINCSEVQSCLPPLSQESSSDDKTSLEPTEISVNNNSQENFTFCSEPSTIPPLETTSNVVHSCEQVPSTASPISDNPLATFTKIHEQTISSEDLAISQQPKEESAENFHSNVSFLTPAEPISSAPAVLQPIESASTIQTNFTDSSLTELSPMKITPVERHQTTTAGLFPPQSSSSFSQQQQQLTNTTTKLVESTILQPVQQNSLDIQPFQPSAVTPVVPQSKILNEIKSEPQIINEPCSAAETSLNSAPAPSLGTIIDSVNKLLSEPDISTGGYSPLSQYSFLSDIQNYCHDDDLLVLQHLGESTASFQNALSDANRDHNNTRLVGSIENNMDRDCWSPNGGDSSKSLMDLDNQQPQQAPKDVSSQQDVTSSSMANTSGNAFNFLPENNNRLQNLSSQFKDDIYIIGLRRGKAQKRTGTTNWMDDHEGKEVVCPTCHSRFLGFSALKAHLNKAHPKQEPTPSGSGSSTSSQVTGINRLGLDFSKNTKLVCPECQQILSSNLMVSHLSTEHDSVDISACQVLPDPIHDPAGGEILKSKLSSALGDLLDKAVNNLLIKSLPETQLRGSASELLTKLYALRMKDNSFKQKIINAQNDTKLKLSEKPKEVDESNAVKNLPTKVSSSDQHCGPKFSSLLKDKSSKLCNKQKDNKATDVYNFTDTEEYDNDWREAPSPSNDDGTAESDTFNPTCSECGLGFGTLNDMMRHRIEDHCRQIRRFSADQSISRPNTPNSSAAVSSCASGSSTPFPSVSTTVLPPTTTTSAPTTSTAVSNVTTAVSLANTLSRLQKRIRSSSVETQSSSGACSVSTKGSRRGGGRGGGGGGGKSRGRNSVKNNNNNTRSSSLSSLNQSTNITQQDLIQSSQPSNLHGENEKKLTNNNINETATTSDKIPEENNKIKKRTVKKKTLNRNKKETAVKTTVENKCNNNNGNKARKCNVNVNNKGKGVRKNRNNTTSSQQKSTTTLTTSLDTIQNELNTTVNNKKRRSSTLSKTNNSNIQLPNNSNQANNVILN